MRVAEWTRRNGNCVSCRRQLKKPTVIEIDQKINDLAEFNWISLGAHNKEPELAGQEPIQSKSVAKPMEGLLQGDFLGCRRWIASASPIKRGLDICAM